MRSSSAQLVIGRVRHQTSFLRAAAPATARACDPLRAERPISQTIAFTSSDSAPRTIELATMRSSGRPSASPEPGLANPHSGSGIYLCSAYTRRVPPIASLAVPSRSELGESGRLAIGGGLLAACGRSRSSASGRGSRPTSASGLLERAVSANAKRCPLVQSGRSGSLVGADSQAAEIPQKRQSEVALLLSRGITGVG